MKRENFAYSENPDFLYRSPESIRSDISDIRRKIDEVKRSFSVRELLMDMLSDTYKRRPNEWIYDLEALVAEASCASGRLAEVREELGYLQEELRESRCQLRM